MHHEAARSFYRTNQLRRAFDFTEPYWRVRESSAQVVCWPPAQRHQGYAPFNRLNYLCMESRLLSVVHIMYILPIVTCCTKYECPSLRFMKGETPSLSHTPCLNCSLCSRSQQSDIQESFLWWTEIRSCGGEGRSMWMGPVPQVLLITLNSVTGIVFFFLF